MDSKQIARILINLQCDIDYLDGAECIETELEVQAELIERLKNFNDLNPLYSLLEMVAVMNEDTRDFVGEMIAFNKGV